MSEPVTPRTETQGSGGGRPPPPPVTCADDDDPRRRKHEQFRQAVESLRRQLDALRKA